MSNNELQNRTTNQRRWTTKILSGQELTIDRELGKFFSKLRYKGIPFLKGIIEKIATTVYQKHKTMQRISKYIV